MAAVGHTEATYAQTRAAVDAGATVATHLFNAMRPIHHREPGPVIALLEDPRVTVEMITDGVHVDGALYRHVTRNVRPDRVSLVTDAMAAAGITDGSYRIGLEVEVADAVAHLAGTDTIAGSTATMDRLFRFAVAHSELPEMRRCSWRFGGPRSIPPEPWDFPAGAAVRGCRGSGGTR